MAIKPILPIQNKMSVPDTDGNYQTLWMRDEHGDHHAVWLHSIDHSRQESDVVTAFGKVRTVHHKDLFICTVPGSSRRDEA